MLCARRAVAAALLFVPVTTLSCGSSSEPAAPSGGAGTSHGVPLVYVGYDAYRKWDHLPDVRLGVRAYMRSTYDRSGGNEGADASHFLRQEADDFNVTLDTAGPGVLYFTRTNHWHGSPWHYVIDGVDHAVEETSTKDPDHPQSPSTFLPAASFPEPFAYTWSTTEGADLDWIPMPFSESLVLAYGRTHYGTGYYIFDRVAEGADHLSSSLTAWSETDTPDPEAVALLARAGEDIGPLSPGVSAYSDAVDVPADAGTSVPLLDVDGGAAALRVLRLRVSSDQAEALSRARLRVVWDDQAEPSVDAPVGLFFGAGSLFNRSGREFLVKGLLATVRFANGDVELSMYYPMPYYKSAHLELASGGTALSNVRFEIRTESWAGHVPFGYFHATYSDEPNPVIGQDLLLLDTDRAEGGQGTSAGGFCGAFVGMSWTFSDNANLSTLEGDPRFFFDDSQTPQAQGTGTEEWGGGGDYWGGQTMTLPLAGHPVGAPSLAEAINDEDKIEGAYRFLLADAMPFGKNARIMLEHGGTDDSSEHYRAVTYWYGLPGACLLESDSLHVGDEADESAHGYDSPTASAVTTLSSRYEWGVDHVGASEIFPQTVDTGRTMNGTTEFSMALVPENVGVLLRRKLDYGIPDQRAEVFVRNDDPEAGGGPDAPWERAGTWYLAGSNACVYSNALLELGPAAQVEEISNRRFRDDEFLIARALTQGRRRVRIRIVLTPSVHPLVPKDAPKEAGWSEFRYTAYSYVVPPIP